MSLKSSIALSHCATFSQPQISACCKVTTLKQPSAIDRPLQLLREMRANGIAPNAFTYTSLICGCEKVAQCDKAIELFNDMHGDGVTPNLLTCNTVLGICERSGRLQYALWAFGEVQKLGVLPDATTYAIMERMNENGD